MENFGGYFPFLPLQYRDRWKIVHAIRAIGGNFSIYPTMLYLKTSHFT
jgi:hypothetical protein